MGNTGRKAIMLLSATGLWGFRETHCLQGGLWEWDWGIRRRWRRNLSRQKGAHNYHLFHMTALTSRGHTTLTPRYSFAVINICSLSFWRLTKIKNNPLLVNIWRNSGESKTRSKCLVTGCLPWKKYSPLCHNMKRFWKHSSSCPL